jgi:5-methylcytosine-specific restriction endonuclease McrBC GTP-binding regulatory subunit McrB
MTTQEINNGIKLICETSTVIQRCYESKHVLAVTINEAKPEDIEKCWEFYKDRDGVVINVRKELFRQMREGKTVTVELLDGLVTKYKAGKENQFRVYKNFYTIFYPAITFYGHSTQRDFISKLTEQLIKDLDIVDRVKTTSFDFQGPRQQGSDRYWLAIYNKEQENQSTGLQFFIDFHHGKMSYGVYKHGNRDFLKEQVVVSPDTFDYDDLLSYFKSEVHLLINDLPQYDAITTLNLEGKKLYKISHGTFKAKNKSKVIETLKENNWIILHELTGKDQARYFKEDLQVGDYVYITLGSKELIGIGKILSDEWNYVPNEIVDNDGWMYREVEFIKAPVRKNPKELKDTRNIFPSGNSTLTEIKPDLLNEANDKLFKPYFNVEFILSNQKKDLKENFINWLVANTSGGNYFEKQFNSNIERFQNEINDYETKYKESFNSELFIISSTDYKNEIEILRANLYNTSTPFSEYSNKLASGRPKAILGKNNYLRFLNEYFSNNEIMESNNQLNKSPLNQILYGPPGTGKTYHTINKSLSIIENKSEIALKKENRKELKNRFDQYVKEGRIVFTTFHQSMSYEDFIEGIKPKIDEDNNENKQVIYEIENGIFKKIANDAKKLRTNTKEVIENYSFDDAWDDLVKNAEKELEDKQPLTLSIQTPNLGLKIIEISGRGNLILKPIYSEGAKEYTVSYLRAKKLQEVFPDLSGIKNIDKEFRAVIGGSNSTAYWSVLNYINTKINENTKVSKQETTLPSLPFVLIIDEINRGNVSQIFGELITLIEEDKRLGKDEALEVTLPYSKEKFGVPANLYIIGTMNTADRSVEALDTALRRRFSFEEMLPDYDLEGLDKEVFGYSLKDILETINKRIVRLLNSEHAIGHSYFLNKNEDTLIDSFYRNIIPLLQEYFFGDYGKMMMVLGDGFVSYNEWSDEDKFFASYSNSKNDYDVKDLYSIQHYSDNKQGFAEAIKKLMNK